MTPGLTPVQARVLAWIRAYVAGVGRAPTVREVAEGAWDGGTSTNNVVEVLYRLQRRGLLSWTRGKARTIKLLDGSCPACGARRRALA
jgi:SOS-response transcriptional repressor LexA